MNKDLDAEWLGVDMKKIDPMHEIMKRVTEEEEEDTVVQTGEEPVGFSRSRFPIAAGLLSPSGR